MDAQRDTVAVEAPCRLLEWDSAFFARRIARVSGSTLTPASVLEIERWCRGHDVECLYFLAASDDPGTVREAERAGFTLVDVRMTFGLRVDETPDCAARAVAALIRPARLDDVPDLKAIARASYRLTRFHFDDGFDTEKSDALYETWIEKSCQGFADAVLVAEVEDGPAAYVTCHLRGAGAGQIGLLGTSDAARGKGLARVLVSESITWFANRRVRTVRVVTQGRNVAAQRLYQRCGFLTESLHLWYHRWFKR